MARYAQIFRPQHTPQSQPIPGRESEMTPNAAGGYGFTVSDWTRVTRFLMIGTEGGTYHEGEHTLTLASARALLACMVEDGPRVVAEIVRISEGGLAPKQAPALFALALCMVRGDAATRKAALELLPRVCRTATHLFELLETYQQFDGGWGRSVRRAVGGWYNDRPAESLAYQMIKYRQRNNWTHRDALRLAHAKPSDSAHELLMGWAAGKRTIESADQSALVWAFQRAQATDDVQEITRLIVDHRLPREAIPDQWLTHAEVWAALLHEMPITALLRNLNRLTLVGLLTPESDALRRVTARLTDPTVLRKGRVHPLAVLIAAATYRAGRGLKGSLMWTPVPQVIQALDAAFEASFVNVQPLGKRILIAVDTSGSMSGFARISGIYGLSPLQASAAAALCYLRTQPDAQVVGFDSDLHDLGPLNGIGTGAMLDRLRNWPGGSTDAALPVNYARERRLAIDALLMLTDGYTWSGYVHPSEALRLLREQTGSPVRLVTVQTASSGTQINDPRDPDSMEMAGFSPDLFAVANAFFRGEL